LAPLGNCLKKLGGFYSKHLIKLFPFSIKAVALSQQTAPIKAAAAVNTSPDKNYSKRSDKIYGVVIPASTVARWHCEGEKFRAHASSKLYSLAFSHPDIPRKSTFYDRLQQANQTSRISLNLLGWVNKKKAYHDYFNELWLCAIVYYLWHWTTIKRIKKQAGLVLTNLQTYKNSQ